MKTGGETGGTQEQLLRDVPDYGIKLDKNGVFWHQGQPVTNPKVAEIFAKSLKKLPGGKYCLQIGFDRCIVALEDAPYVVRRLLMDGGGGGTLDRVVLELSDGTSEDLDPSTLEMSEDNVLYCRVKGGDHIARFDRAPYFALAEYIVEHQGGYALEVGGKSYPISKKQSEKP